MDEQNAPQDQQQAAPPVPAAHPGPPATQAPHGAIQMAPNGMMIRPMRYTPETFKSLYTWWMILVIVGSVLTITIIGAILGMPILIAAAVLGYMQLYKHWNQIQDGHQKTTPGKAVGFMFIPFFNFYWQFVAFLGLAQNINAYGDRHGISFPRVNEGLAMTMCILVVCCIIPYLGFLVMLAVAVISIIMFGQFKTASMAIAASQVPGQRA